MFEERRDDCVAVGRRANFESHVAQQKKKKEGKSTKLLALMRVNAAANGPRNTWKTCVLSPRLFPPAPVGGNLIPGDNGWATLFQRSRFTGDLRPPPNATARLPQQQVPHQARTRQQRQLCVRNGSEISRNAGTAKNKLSIHR